METHHAPYYHHFNFSTCSGEGLPKPVSLAFFCSATNSVKFTVYREHAKANDIMDFPIAVLASLLKVENQEAPPHLQLLPDSCRRHFRWYLLWAVSPSSFLSSASSICKSYPSFWIYFHPYPDSVPPNRPQRTATNKFYKTTTKLAACTGSSKRSQSFQTSLRFSVDIATSWCSERS